jgi:peptidoglycan hydrolase-like protein with peptidoglycan-binding domain
MFPQMFLMKRMDRSLRPRIIFASLVMGLLALSLAPQLSAARSSDDIKKEQQMLADKGYSPGPVDGVVGPQTRKAIGDYQKAEGLKVTHHIDSATANKLGVPQESAGGKFDAAGHDVADGGKSFGREIKKGNPIDAGKDLGEGVGEGGKKTGQGVAKAVTP